jgi:hypothetical protein
MRSRLQERRANCGCGQQGSGFRGTRGCYSAPCCVACVAWLQARSRSQAKPAAQSVRNLAAPQVGRSSAPFHKRMAQLTSSAAHRRGSQCRTEAPGGSPRSAAGSSAGGRGGRCTGLVAGPQCRPANGQLQPVSPESMPPLLSAPAQPAPEKQSLRRRTSTSGVSMENMVLETTGAVCGSTSFSSDTVAPSFAGYCSVTTTGRLMTFAPRTMRRAVSMTAGKPVITGRKRS